MTSTLATSQTGRRVRTNRRWHTPHVASASWTGTVMMKDAHHMTLAAGSGVNRKAASATMTPACMPTSSRSRRSTATDVSSWTTTVIDAATV